MSQAIATTEHPKKHVTVKGKKMAYVEMGEGDPIVFLHGNPTSSYLWRNIMPHLKSQGRCIAPDLIGMGDSDKLDNVGPNSYRFVEHRDYLDGILEALNVKENVTLVIHDWGSALGFDWANRHRDAVKAIAYMEGIVRPVEWSEWSKEATGVFQGFRSPAGEDMEINEKVQTLVIHSSLGMSVFLLMIARLLWRRGHTPPALPDHMPGWQVTASKASHHSLYLLTLLQPLFGLGQSMFADYTVRPFGLLSVSMGANESLHKIFHVAHGLNGRLLVALVLLHVAAALYHHFVQKDTVLKRMLPYGRV